VSADCENAGGDACAMDRVYLTSVASTPTTALIDFPNQTSPSRHCDVPADRTKGLTTTAANTAGTQEQVEGCVLDQNNNVITNSVAWAFQASPVDPAATAAVPTGFNQAGGGVQEGTAHDTNGDHFFEQAGGAAGTSGSVAQVTFKAGKAQGYTLTFCVDANGDAFGTTPSPTPCAS